MAAAIVAALAVTTAGQESQDPQVFRFRTGVELINVTVTVTDANGRFVSGLRKEDFRLLEDGQEQQVTHFNSERVPVSLGLVVDTSGSMEGEKWVSARQALNRFLFQLLDRDDEVFLYRFDNQPELIESWTTDRERVATGLARIRPRGATSLYDAVAAAVPLAQTGPAPQEGDRPDLRRQRHEQPRHDSRDQVDDPIERSAGVCDRDRYAGRDVAIVGRPAVDADVSAAAGSAHADSSALSDSGSHESAGAAAAHTRRRRQAARNSRGRIDDRLNVSALRDITDESGGRTEIVRFARDVDPATSSVADELSKQYYLGYSSQARKDGQWHTIRVELRDGRHLVRARKGYVALP